MYTEITISVRSLVEFLLRSGDLDNRRGTGGEELLQEGSRMHRQIQKAAGDGYRAEVPLKLTWKFDKKLTGLTGEADAQLEDAAGGEDAPARPYLDDAAIIIEGRADGVYTGAIPGNARGAKNIYDFSPCITVDEIKTTYRKITRIRKPEPVHLAQARCYAYMLACRDSLDRVNVRMTYCNLYSGEIRYFYFNETREGLHDWFLALMEEYRKWAEYLFTWQVLRTNAIRNLDFPFPYREGQRMLVGGVYRTIERGRKLFLEAPTGTGKTITTLYPAIRGMGQGFTERIFYLTAKTITRTAVEETTGLLREKGLLFKSVTLTAKAKICFLDTPQCNPEKCPVAKGHYDRINACLFDLLKGADDFSRETILTYAVKHQVCPFELSLDLTYFADLIIGDYNYVFDPHAYLRRFFGDGSTKGSHVFLIDEAHNLLERGREMYSATLERAEVRSAAALAQGIFPALAKKLSALATALDRLRERTGGFSRLQEADGIAGLTEQAVALMEQVFSELRIADQTGTWKQDPLYREKRRIQEAILPFYFNLSHFLYIHERLDDHYVIYAGDGDELPEEELSGAGAPRNALPMKETLPSVSGAVPAGRGRRKADTFFVRLYCVDPSVNLKACMDRGRASVLFSATFLPIQYYKSLLGGTKEDYEMYAHSVFDPRKRGLFIVDDLTSRYSRRSRENYERIAGAIHAITANRHGNYMIFFPSFLFMRETAVAYARLYCTKEEAEAVLAALLPPKALPGGEERYALDDKKRQRIRELYEKRKERSSEEGVQLSLFSEDEEFWGTEIPKPRLLTPDDSAEVLWESLFAEDEVALPEEKAGEKEPETRADTPPAVRETPIPPVPMRQEEPVPYEAGEDEGTEYTHEEGPEKVPGAEPSAIDADTTLLFQRSGMTEEEREAFLSAFRVIRSDRSLLGFCILGGIFSEGIDLREDALIGVVVVGTGIPSPTRERELVREYFNKQGENGFDYAYRYPGMNKVLQAAGRVIRTVNDVGIVALVDERFTQRSNRQLFPAEWDNAEPVSSREVAKRVERFWDEWL